MEEPVTSVLPRLEVRPSPSSSYPGLAGLPDARVRSGASDVALFTGATLAAQLILFAAGLVQKRLLGPTALGYWSLISTLQIILTLATLGALAGAGRQIPFHRGRGAPADAAAVADTGASFAVLSSAVAGLLIAL